MAGARRNMPVLQMLRSNRVSKRTQSTKGSCMIRGWRVAPPFVLTRRNRGFGRDRVVGVWRRGPVRERRIDKLWIAPTRRLGMNIGFYSFVNLVLFSTFHRRSVVVTRNRSSPIFGRYLEAECPQFPRTEGSCFPPRIGGWDSEAYWSD